ncbi:MAG: hypothetical protein ACR2KV_03560 [Solirubrobacteraceae bacterium]
MAPGSEGGAKSAGGFRPPPGGGPVVIPGEHTVEIDGTIVALGDKLILRPGVDRDPYDKMLHGRVATLERVYVDTNGKVYLGVTVDDDAAQEILRESGRYLFFFLPEVEVP